MNASNNKAVQNGFTLVEVMVALAVLSILMVVVSLPIVTFFRMNATSSTALDATAAAQDALEKARTLVLREFDSPQTDLTTLNASLPNSAALTVTVSCADLNASGTVTSASCTAIPAGTTPVPPATLATPNVSMRRLTALATTQGQTAARLTLDVRP